MSNEKIIDMINKHEENIKKYGFTIHVITDDDDNFVELHTHGILQNFGNLDLQIKFVPDLTLQKAYDIITEITSIISEDGSFREFDIVRLDIDELKIEYVFRIVQEKIIELGNDTTASRTLLRIIIPDENDLYPWEDKCNPYYKEQFTDKDRRINNYILN